MSEPLDFSPFRQPSGNFYRVSFLPYTLSDGAAYAIQACRAYWLTDAIAKMLMTLEDNDTIAEAVFTEWTNDDHLLSVRAGGRAGYTVTEILKVDDFPFDRWPARQVTLSCAKQHDGTWRIFLPEEY